MKCIKLVDPNVVVVKVTDGVVEGRPQTLLWFEQEYPDAVHAALEAIEFGCTNVTVFQRRQVLHTHDELVQQLGRAA